MKYPASNPSGMRTVTVIVTHEDPARDFSRTYTARQVAAERFGYTEHSGHGPFVTRDWRMTTFEDAEP